jgi:hypothetical protein
MADDVDPRRFSAARPPAVVLGGLNIVRAAGLGAIPVVVASSNARDAAFASRYCRGRILLPSTEDPHAVAETLLRAGERSAAACRSSTATTTGSGSCSNTAASSSAATRSC